MKRLLVTLLMFLAGCSSPNHEERAKKVFKEVGDKVEKEAQR